MAATAAAADQESGLDDYTKDGTVDLKGNPILRFKTGRWKACSFMIVYELIERTMFTGIAANLIIYLTTKLNQGTVTASNNVTNWTGTVWITPILGAYIADAHFGRYRTFLLSSVVCLMAMSLLTLTVSVPSLKPPTCLEVNRESCKQASKLQLAMFFGSLYLLALASGGTKPNIATMGADQFDDFHLKEKAQKLSFFNWWLFSVFSGILFASTILVYIQDNVGWSLGYGIPTIGLAVAILIFVAGTPLYRHKLPTGSPFTRMANVIVAAAFNWRLPLPHDPNQLHELEPQEYSKRGTFKIDPTPSLRFLNKAAIIREDSGHRWRWCTVTQVEETKQMLRMIPILICTFIPSTMVAQSHTLFIKQGTTLDRSIGSHFKVPPASLYAFVTISMLLSILIYDRIFVKIMQRVTKNPRGITMLQRMGIGMICHVLIMTVASRVERHRLDVARENGLSGQGEVPLTIFILLPQFVLTGVADALLQIANVEFFYDQAPENMKSLGSSFSMTSLGIGNFLSSFIVATVSEITQNHGNNHGWILNNLNASHLDSFYALLAVMSGVNFFLFLLISQFYVYKPELSDSIKLLTHQLKNKKSNPSIPTTIHHEK